MTALAESRVATSTPPTLTGRERLQRSLFTGLGRLPQRLLRRLGPPVVNAAGDRMAPEIALLMRLSAGGPDFSDAEVAEARTMIETESRVFADEAPPGVSVDPDLVLPNGVRASLYRPAEPSDALVVFLHGGGFVLGSRAAYDVPARLIAAGAGVNVLSVEYRLAPESPFPGPVDDAIAAWDFAVERCAAWGVDAGRIVLLGDSAGGNLCAVLSNVLASNGGAVRPALQVLLYPVVDAVGDYPSRTEFADSPALSIKQIDWLSGLYLRDDDRADPRVSPILADDLAGAPPTVVTVAGFDPLRDEAIAYAERLAAAGVPVRLLREGGLVHGYISMTRISPATRDAVDRVVEVIAEFLGSRR